MKRPDKPLLIQYRKYADYLEAENKKLKNEIFLLTETVNVCKECGEIVEGDRCGSCRGDFGTNEITLKEYEDGN